MLASDRRTPAYNIVVGVSIWHAACWVVYLLYMSNTEIDKQSVYVGAITFYSAILFASSLVALICMISAVGLLAYRRNPFLRLSIYWLIGAVSVMVGVYAITEIMINRAIN
jgi:hypothetical protein